MLLSLIYWLPSHVEFVPLPLMSKGEEMRSEILHDVVLVDLAGVDINAKGGDCWHYGLVIWLELIST